MENLPIELLHNIFILLPIIQKQECMFVCRRWASLIRSRSLFHTITICYEDGVSSWLVERFIDLIYDRPDIGSQVEEIKLGNTIETYKKMELLSRLPNVNKIVSTSPNVVAAIDLLRPTFSEYFDRKYRIQYLDNGISCGWEHFLMENELSSQLVTLKAPLELVEGVSDIFDLLPSLKYLTIRDVDVTFDGLEELHSTITSLETLELRNVTLLIPIFSGPLVPATQLTRLSVFGGEYSTLNQVTFNWPKYITQKYTNLKHFHCLMKNTMNFKFDPRCTDQLGYTALLPNIGSKLESWSVDYRQKSNVDVLKALDSFNCQIKNMTMNLDEELSILDDLAKTDQLRYIENLVLHEINPVQTFSTLKLMDNLKTLTLHFHSYNPTVIDAGDLRRVQEFTVNQIVNLSTIFEQLSEFVESVSVTGADITYKLYGHSQHFYIKKLRLNNVKIHGQIDSFISNHFPYLHSLTLKNCLRPNEVVYLWKHHFSYLKLDDYCINILLITSDVRLPRVYCSKRADRNNYSDLDCLYLPMRMGALDNESFITLVCGSVKRLFLGEYEAYLVSDEYQSRSFINKWGESFCLCFDGPFHVNLNITNPVGRRLDSRSVFALIRPTASQATFSLYSQMAYISERIHPLTNVPPYHFSLEVVVYYRYRIV